MAPHLFGVSLLDQAPADEDAQDAAAQIGLCLGCGGLIDCAGQVEEGDGPDVQGRLVQLRRTILSTAPSRCMK